jgi:hypothetical protein
MSWVAAKKFRKKNILKRIKTIYIIKKSSIGKMNETFLDGELELPLAFLSARFSVRDIDRLSENLSEIINDS